ncbi:class I SAM-dependent methyltransferase [Methylocystis bryophila]|uniref:16S rRNA (Cytosine(1402)-N(4))-methyltransferase n=1 Tax=Methylocystis bryophila TaxID=655015 RepID=A0A1W6MYQ1_9HYPH|nr:class I SAM-dependent methyltransferase [Methylocystis bryophila]ARN82717.1 16S rRNA (cytosine(1402)-N(4))-methyltransferase [Methylocystis bryophila]BDV38948.1 methyltransferase [Methylocystis bryophila]
MTSPHSETIRVAFDSAAANYDAQRRKLIPDFDSFYGIALNLLEEAVGDRPFACIDLGVGTGLFSEMVLQRFPRATIEGLDFAPKMIETARGRLAGYGERMRLRLADYDRAPLGGPVEAVVSALSIHHLEHEAKRRLFREIHAALAAGGVFVNADQSLGVTPEVEAAYQARWEHDVKAAGVSDEDFAAAQGRVALDRSATFADQLAWLEEAGFADADIAWKRHRFTVFCARK